MIIPFSLQKPEYRERKRAKERIAREAEWRKKALGITNIPFTGRKPSTTLMILGVMIVVGGMLIWRSSSRPNLPSGSGQIDRAVKELTILCTALDCFKIECGRYPTTEEGLAALIRSPGAAGWDGPYVNLIKPDPWKNIYVYSCEDGIVTLFSCGPDGSRNTADDVFPEMELSSANPR